jgi:hypothetical protein
MIDSHIEAVCSGHETRRLSDPKRGETNVDINWLPLCRQNEGQITLHTRLPPARGSLINQAEVADSTSE